MILPTYKYMLDGFQCYPVVDGVALDFSRKDESIDFNKKLTGKIIFIKDDYRKIVDSSIMDFHNFSIIRKSEDGTEVIEFEGYFSLADCEVNEDYKYLEAKIKEKSNLAQFQSFLKREFNIVDICPSTEQVRYYKRGFYQFYIPGSDVLTCVNNGNYWTQKCTVVDDLNELFTKYYFSSAQPSGQYADKVPKKAIITTTSGNNMFNGCYVNSVAEYDKLYDSDKRYYLTDTSAGENKRVINLYDSQNPGISLATSGTIDVQGLFDFDVTLTGSNISLAVKFRGVRTVMRYVTNLYKENDPNLVPIPADDMAGDNKNFLYIRKLFTDIPVVTVSNEMQTDPSKLGRFYLTRKYYKEKESQYPNTWYIPISPNLWEGASVWINIGDYGLGGSLESTPVILRDAYTLQGVLQAFLREFEREKGIRILHENTDSEFLYSVINPITKLDNSLIFLTQKTNILHSGYSDPAHKAVTTLENVLKMLENTFNLKWTIDSGNLRIEHVSYFINGGSYTEEVRPVGFDMTAVADSRTMKRLSEGINKYNFDSLETPFEIVYSYTEDSSYLFSGEPIRPSGANVNPDKTDKIQISGFTADIDRMVCAPEDFSKDGLTIMACDRVPVEGAYSLKIGAHNVVGILGSENTVQNYIMSIPYLFFNFGRYNIPYYEFKYGTAYNNMAITKKRLKKQSVEFQMPEGINTRSLVKTDLGNGYIEKISINLANRNHKIELSYDTK